MNYEQAKAQRDALEATLKAASAVMGTFSTNAVNDGPMTASYKYHDLL